MSVRISAFADEIGPDPALQVKTLQALAIRYVELRGAWGCNVLKLSDSQVKQLQRLFADEGIAVSCIASPIGKVRLDEDWQKHFDDFKHAVDLAEAFGAEYVRIFSYYAPKADKIENHREEVVGRLQAQAEYVADRPVTLALENETGIYGDTPERCRDLMAALPDAKIVLAFDPANFVAVDAVPVYDRCWLGLREFVGYFHMKDAVRRPERRAVPVGEGEGDCEKILADAARDGYSGFLALEPHLSQAGQFGGFTGPELFTVAAEALKALCDKAGLAIE